MCVLARTISGLIPTLAVGLAGLTCYAPALVDCTVSCAGPADCANGQVCGADGLCAAPDVAGRCAIAPDAGEIDAGPPVDAPGPVDAPPPPPIDAAVPDAPPPMIRLRVQIMGKGRVIVDGRGTCSSSGTQGDCTFDVARGVALTVRAVPIQLDEWFKSWTSMTCRNQSATCTFTPTVETSVAARFERADRSADRDERAVGDERADRDNYR